MEKRTGFFRNHKKAVIAASILLVLAITGAVVGIVLHIRAGKTRDQDDVSDLVEMMADLVNEPVSPEDEPYQPEEEQQSDPIRIMVNKKRNCITVYDKKSNQPVRAMICSVGYNTPVGTFYTSDRYTWKIVNGNVWSQYATRITGNVLFHSVPYGQKDKSTLISKYYNRLGTNASAGCIRVMVSDAKWLMEHCAPDTEVEIYEDNDPGPLGKPISIVVSADEQWDPSDPDPENPWLGHKAVLEGAVNRTVERNIDFDYLTGLSGKDTVGNDITAQIKVDTDLDINKVGTYKVKYTLTDGIGSTDSVEVVYTVADRTPPCFSGIKKEVHVPLGEEVSVDELLDHVYVADNNEILDKDRINVEIPPVEEGESRITYTIRDDYGNVATAYTTMIVDNEPPQLFLYSDAGHILDSSQAVNEEFALSRVYATDSGTELPRDAISVTIYNADWGYTFVYVATDKSGQTATMTDSVSYMSYTITADGILTVTDLSAEQLLQGVVLKNSAGQELGGENIQIDIQNTMGNQYLVTYRYDYSSPLGTRSATAARSVMLASGETPAPAGTSAPSEAPQTSVTPEPMVLPTTQVATPTEVN